MAIFSVQIAIVLRILKGSFLVQLIFDLFLAQKSPQKCPFACAIRTVARPSAASIAGTTVQSTGSTEG